MESGILFLFLIYLGVSHAVFFNGTTFHEEYVCEHDGQISGLCEQSDKCRPPATGQGDCGVQGSRLVCCSSRTSSDSSTGSKSRAKCAEYSALGQVKECPAFRPFSGSNKVKTGEHPHIVAVGYYNRRNKFTLQCAGSLISERYVLTTQVCGNGSTLFGSPKLVRVGATNLKSQNALDVEVEQHISHPEISRRSKLNDIGLLKLKRAVSFSKAVRPACLHTTFDIPASRGVVAGWGITETGQPSDVLRKADLPLVLTKICDRMYKEQNVIMPNRIDDRFTLCAGELAGGKDSCIGDSGAPLVMKLAQPYCTYSIIGISSFGIITQCGSPYSPGFYTRVSSYIPWIESVVWPN